MSFIQLQEALLSMHIKVLTYQNSSCFELLSQIDLKENMNEKYLKSIKKQQKQLSIREINFYQITQKIKRQINLLIIDISTNDYMVLKDFLKEQKKLRQIINALDKQNETVYFLIAYTDQQKEYDQCQFCIFFKIYYNKQYHKLSQYKIQHLLQEFIQNINKSNEERNRTYLEPQIMDNTSMMSQNLQVQKEQLIQSFCGFTNSEIIYVECMDKDLEMKDDKRKNVIKEIRDESIQIRQMNYKNNPKFKILMLQRGDEENTQHILFDAMKTFDKHNRDRSQQISNLSRLPNQFQPRLPQIESLRNIKKQVADKRDQGKIYDFKLDKVSQIDHCINALQTQQYQKLISQVQYQNIQKRTSQHQLYHKHVPQSTVNKTLSQSYFINPHYCPNKL